MGLVTELVLVQTWRDLLVSPGFESRKLCALFLFLPPLSAKETVLYCVVKELSHTFLSTSL